MRATHAPAPGRRTILKLLAASVAGRGLSNRAAAAATAIAVEDALIRIEVDEQLHTCVLAKSGDVVEPITDFEPSETLVLADGRRIANFALSAVSSATISDVHGLGSRHVLRGASSEGIEKELSFVLYSQYPGLVLVRVAYRNGAIAPAEVTGWVNGAHVLKRHANGSADFWSFSGASHEDRRDWVQPLKPGFRQRNYMGMSASDYGGGIPVVDVWRRDWGLAVGHLETVPKLVALPLTMDDAGARLAVECTQAFTLHPGASFSTHNTFVAVHRRDYFPVLDAYRRLMAERGLQQAEVPVGAYEPLWCAWGYERDFTLEQVKGTLGKAKELSLGWAGIDDGWQIAVGDWRLNPQKFPQGDADMVALVDAVKSAGLRAKLWLAPLAAHPRSELLRDHADMLLLDDKGAPQTVSWWDSYTLCPAYAKTVEQTTALVGKMIKEWGYAGLKLDGQHLNAVAPCYNAAHHHARPEESVEKLQQFWRAIYQTATAIDPQVVIEICPCGTAQAFHHMPYQNQAVASDPESSWQVRHKGKTIKALMGPAAPYAGDHVELSDGGNDFASTVGIGAVVSTKFTWPRQGNADPELLLTPDRERLWRRWIALYNEKRLAEGQYRGELYDIGFDKPETHAITKNGRWYYSFYGQRWDGPIELRGLASGRYRVDDYWNGRTLGTITAAANRIFVAFNRFLLLEAVPLEDAS